MSPARVTNNRRKDACETAATTENQAAARPHLVGHPEDGYDMAIEGFHRRHLAGDAYYSERHNRAGSLA